MTDPDLPPELAALDLDETTIEAYKDGALSAEHIKHTQWWGKEMDRCRRELAPILEYVRQSETLTLHRHGTKTGSDGQHEIHVRFQVDGEPYDD